MGGLWWWGERWKTVNRLHDEFKFLIASLIYRSTGTLETFNFTTFGRVQNTRFRYSQYEYYLNTRSHECLRSSADIFASPSVRVFLTIINSHLWILAVRIIELCRGINNAELIRTNAADKHWNTQVTTRICNTVNSVRRWEHCDIFQRAK